MIKIPKKLIKLLPFLKVKFRFSKKLVTILICTVAIFLLPFVVIEISQKGKISNGIIIASIPVGGKSQSEALQILSSNFSPPLEVNLTFEDRVYKIPTDQNLVVYNLEESVKKAYFLTRTGNIFYDFIQKISLLSKSKHMGINITLNEELLDEKILNLLGNLEVKSQIPSITYEKDEIYVSPGKTGRMIDDIYLKALVGQRLSYLNDSPIEIPFIETGYVLSQDEIVKAKERAGLYISKSLNISFNDYKRQIPDSTLIGFIHPREKINETNISDFIAEISKEIDKDPQDSVFIFEEGSVKEFTPSKEGYALDKTAFKEALIQKMDILFLPEVESEEIILPVIVTQPKIQNRDVNNLGIDTLLGKGTSKFTGSIANRVYNIKLASSNFKSILVAPDETFSFNEHLGDVSTETGYKQAYIIREGKTILGDGGGVCQVSTTLFRALLNAGLPITERQAHAYRVGYYEQDSPPGLDATVYSPHPDLKFKNNTPKYILIQATMDAKNYRLTFEIYGTSDGRIATITKPKVSAVTPPSEDLYIDDPTLPMGTLKQTEYRSSGAKVSFDYQVIRDEEVIYKKTFYSNYQPWQAVYLRGTKPN